MTVARWELAAADRVAAAHARAAGGAPVIGTVGRSVPSVLIEAVGAEALALPDDGGVDPYALALLGRAVDRAAVRILSALLAGAHDGLRGVVIGNDSEASRRLFYALRELRRDGALAMPVTLLDVGALDRPATRRFAAGRLEQLARELEAWTGTELTPERYRAAAAERRALRAALEAVRSARRDPAAGVDGLDALRAYRIARSGPPSAAARTLRAGLEETVAAGPDDRYPLYLTGSAPADEGLYRLLETGSGARIVGDDHPAGDPVVAWAGVGGREPAAATREEISASLAAEMLALGPSTTSRLMAERARETAVAVRETGARGVLAVVRPGDEAPLWDASALRRDPPAPLALLRQDDDAPDPADVRDALLAIGAAP